MNSNSERGVDKTKDLSLRAEHKQPLLQIERKKSLEPEDNYKDSFVLLLFIKS